MRIAVCLISFSCLAACANPPGESTASSMRPNIVFVFADDLGYGDVGCNNAESKIATPAVDRLAREGMRFTDAHAPGPWCIPSRYGLLTGRYPMRAKFAVKKRAAIAKDQPTLASVLRERGYATSMVGKWHLGFDRDDPNDWSADIRGGPIDSGFESYFGIPESLDIPPYYYIRNRRVVAAPTDRIAAKNTAGWTKIQGEFWRAGGIAPGFVHSEVHGRFEDEALRFLDRRAAANDGRPFFLYLALASPHTPWLPSREFRGKSSVDLYGDFVMEVDATVGKILDRLDDHGMSRDTIVVFTSDNGPVWYPQDVAKFGHRSVGTWRGMKSDTWEGGHRMPFVVRWPARVRAGSTSRQTICFTDMLATFADITGAPPQPSLDSVSILPLLDGVDRPVRETTILHPRATVLRHRHWKLITHLGSGGFSKPRRVKPRPGGPTGQLYDLREDPSETTNLWLARPQVVARLSKLLRDLSAR